MGAKFLRGFRMKNCKQKYKDSEFQLGCLKDVRLSRYLTQLLFEARASNSCFESVKKKIQARVKIEGSNCLNIFKRCLKNKFR